MWPDRVSNPGPLTYESGALPITLRGPTEISYKDHYENLSHFLDLVSHTVLYAAESTIFTRGPASSGQQSWIPVDCMDHPVKKVKKAQLS